MGPLHRRARNHRLRLHTRPPRPRHPSGHDGRRASTTFASPCARTTTTCSKRSSPRCTKAATASTTKASPQDRAHPTRASPIDGHARSPSAPLGKPRRPQQARSGRSFPQNARRPWATRHGPRRREIPQAQTASRPASSAPAPTRSPIICTLCSDTNWKSRLISGDLAVKDLPAAWNERSTDPDRHHAHHRPRRRPARRPLGLRHVRLFPDLHAGQPLRGPDDRDLRTRPQTGRRNRARRLHTPAHLAQATSLQRRRPPPAEDLVTRVTGKGLDTAAYFRHVERKFG